MGVVKCSTHATAAPVTEPFPTPAIIAIDFFILNQDDEVSQATQKE